MTVKLIGVFLTLSYIFLCALGDLKITEEQFAKFEGTDPTKYCGSKQNMEKFCSEVLELGNGKHEVGPFKKDYPECQNADVKVEKNCGGGTVLKKTNVIVCAWENENLYYVYGKGQTSGNVMCYLTDNKGICNFYSQLQYTGF